jgi:energy-coupling factor transporter ATP-binding protein EcfA2
MTLKKVSYSEYQGEPREWSLEPLDFGPANLVVGRNATGKSRLINIITSLMHVLSGKRTVDRLTNGAFYAEFDIAGNSYIYEIHCKDSLVAKERLTLNGEVKLERDAEGKGSIFYQKQQASIEFEIEPSAIAFQARRDRLQHPYIMDLYEWAEASATYQFGSDFGKNTLKVAIPNEVIGGQTTSAAPTREDPADPLQTYVQAFATYGDAFDQAVVADMRSMGFPISAVNAELLDPGALSPRLSSPLMTLSVTEDGIAQNVTQITLSQGMFRALALCIKLNWAIFSGRRGLLLIDDLGEGLDFERACSAIELTMKKALQGGCQVIVSSNDRFVMNSVALEHWVALKRDGNRVKGYTQRNSPEAFKNFRFTGLSNFDFFTSEAFH